MPWTGSRSRDDWLAEVRRRGERIRRRRRFTVAVAGAFALVLPLSAASGYLAGQPDRGVELSVAGPAPAPAGGPAPEPGVQVPGQPPPVDELATTTTTTEVHGRIAAINGSASPAIPPADDPVVRPTATTAPPADEPVLHPTTTLPTPPANVAVARPNQSTPATNSLRSAATPALGPCAADALQIDVVPAKATFAAGETVRGTFFVQTARATECTVAMPASFRIENVATGRVIASVDSVTEFTSPVPADGRMYTSTFAWEQQDCSGATCGPVPPGLYQAVAEWGAGSSYRGWGEFRIGA